MHRRGGHILSHTKKTNPNIPRTKPRQWVETDERVFKETSKNFYKQGKQVTPAHAAHTHATLPKYFAGIVHSFVSVLVTNKVKCKNSVFYEFERSNFITLCSTLV